MNVNAVSFGRNPLKSTQPKESNPVRTGAKIGAGVGIGCAALQTGISMAVPSLRANMKEGFGMLAEIMGGKGKLGASLAVGAAVAVGIYAALGAGIGAIVKAVKNHKAEKAEAPEKK